MIPDGTTKSRGVSSFRTAVPSGPDITSVGPQATPSPRRGTSLMKWSASVLSAFLLLPAFAFGDGAAPNWVRVTDKAAWRPRDSSGEVVFKDQLWLLGGWFDSFMAPPRDVWSSPDGKTWKLVRKEAPWKHSDLPMTLVFKDRMWLLGGWFNGRLPGHSASNEVWSSADGENCEPVTRAASWSPRMAARVVRAQGSIWLL